MSIAAAPLNFTLDPLSDSGISNADLLTNVTTPTLTGTAEAGATIKLFDGAILLGTTVADSNGDWQVVSKALKAGEHALNFEAADLAGNVATSNPITITIDDKAPAKPSGVNLLSDNGASATDHVTSVNTLTLQGQAEYSSEVTVYEGDTLIGTSLGGTSSGGWTIESTTRLSEGVHYLTFKATDWAGNTSVASSPFKVTIDNSEAAPTGLDLTTKSDLGLSNTDNLTSSSEPVIAGKAGAGDQIAVFDNGTLVSNAAANAAGVWSVATVLSGDGVHHLTASATDQFGNVSQLSDELVLTLDATPPAISDSPTLDALADTGLSNTDLLTKITRPTLTGSAEAGSAVKLFDGATQVGATVADADGKWSITSKALAAGAHEMSFTATDAAGGVATSHAITITIDNQAPAGPATDIVLLNDNGDSTTDHVIGSNTAALRGQAEPDSVVFVYEGNTLVGRADVSSDGGWDTTTTALADGVHHLTIKVGDMAGNISASTATFQVTTDTTEAAPTALDLTTASDLGASNTDNLTGNTPTITGKAGANDTVWLSDGDNGYSPVRANAAGVWSITPFLAVDGVHHLRAIAIDQFGNVSQLSDELVITTESVAPVVGSGPVLDAASDSGVSDSDLLTNVATPTMSGTAEAGATIRLLDGAIQVGTAIADADGSWSITSKVLKAGVHDMSFTATDAAGNWSNSSVLTITVDTKTPAPTGIILMSDNGASTTDHVTSSNMLALRGQAEYSADVKVYEGDVLIGTSLGGTSSGGWTIEPTVALAEGVHYLTFKATDWAGNTSLASSPFKVTIDNSEAAPTGLDLVAKSDLGASNADNLTSSSEPVITGKAGAGDQIAVFDNGVLVSQSSTNAAGVWSIGSVLSGDGAHHLTASATDQFGNVSQLSDELVLTLDTTAPAISNTPAFDALSDSGWSNNDLITKVTTPTLTGTAEAGAAIKVFDGAVQIGTTVADADGNWSVTSKTLKAGLHELTFQATDLAGNVATSEITTATIDNKAPAAPTALLLLTDDGVSATDKVTSISAPALQGQAEAYAHVSLYDGGTLIGGGNADGNGNWYIESLVSLANGAHALTAKADDVAGNVSAASAALKIVIEAGAGAEHAVTLVGVAHQDGLIG